MADESITQEGSAEESKKLPKPSYFLLAFGFADSMGVFFTKAIYTLFLRNKLGLTNAAVVAIIRIDSMIVTYLTPIGAIIIDSVSNRFVVLTISESLSLVLSSFLTLLALPSLRHLNWYLLGMKIFMGLLANVAFYCTFSAFGGDQFNLPAQQPAFVKFLQISYIIHNIGVLLAYYIGPRLKTNVACLGEQECYVLGFGISFSLYAVALIILVLGFRFYTIRKPVRNMAVDTLKCIGYGFTHWIRERKTNPRGHWLDHAEPAYGAQLVDDLKRVFHVCAVMCTLPILYSVYDQLYDKWLFQAARLDGRIGTYTIIAEHFQLLNPLLSIIMLPLFMKFLDPVIIRWGMDRLFRRMIFGGLMLSLAFACAGFLESQVKKTNPTLPGEGEAQLRIFNGFDCTCVVKTSKFFNNSIEINAHGAYADKHVPVEGYQTFQISVRGSCFSPGAGQIYLEPGKAISVHIGNNNGVPDIKEHVESVDKSESGLPLLTVIGAKPADALKLEDSKGVQIHLVPETEDVAGHEISTTSTCRIVEVIPESYQLFWQNKNVLNFKMHLGGLYLIMLMEESASFFEITEPNSVHMAWIIPQSILLIFAEVYFLIAMDEFSYSEAPMSLKSFTQSLSYFFTGMGDMFVVIITLFGNMEQDYEFYFFAFIQFLNMIMLFFIARRFKSITPDTKII